MPSTSSDSPAVETTASVGSHQICAGYEPIHGYTLEQKIGAGGFGEVWRANAPGDLKKAVKFVFGASDAKRGNRELKSLERIKGVHHPFLLTLERFGIVEDRLVIVTELADGSLEEVLQRHLDRGSCGIPRAALLSYLHDAADALDYLHTRYQLQHLDVKPGNLLMVGGHVKVGDFGLLKDLRDNDQSIVGGLTPIYAPPELFDGRPAMNSDQYSLAVMYQELLTGTRPFAGRTIAQLATQHIHAAPNLEPLPPADRVAVARALEKNPDRRFENCKAFVDALRSPGSANNTVSVRENRRGAAKRPSHSAPTRGNVEDLPELNSSATHLHSRVTGHAFVVAVGGVGAEILHELRGRVAELHAACPLDLHSVLIDTDMHTIHAARLTEASDRIPPTVMVHTPLKTAQEYRQSNTKPLSSMSRRWIYNVPRSATTEGLRPLGRLAMVGHAEEVDQALRESIDHLAAVCGDRVPSVYLVGSLSGGTASGMMWDLAPRLRQLLDEAGLQSAGVLPLLTTVSIQGNPHQPLTLINTHAAVSELRHYLTPGHSYPGDPGVAWDPVPAARNPLHDAYLIVDGDRASPVSSSAAATVVDYLWADSTGAGELLAQARKIANLETGQIGKPMLRSVGVARLQCLRALEQKLLAPAAVRHLMLGWLGHPAEAEQIAKPLAERLRKRCQIEPQQWLAELLEQYGRNDVARQELVSSFVKQIDTAQIQNGCQGIDIDEKLRKMLEGGKLASLSQRRSGDVMATLRRELTTRLHDRGIDVTGAIHGIAVFRQNLVAACKQLNEELSSHADEGCMHSRDADSVAGSASMTDLIEQTERFVLRRMHAITTQLVLDQLEELIKETAPIAESLQQMAVTVAQGARCVPGDQQDSENPWDDMPQEIRIRFQDVLKNLHSQVSQQWLIQPLLRTRDVDSPSMDQIARMVDEMVSSCLPVVESIIDRHRSTHSTRGESIGSTTTGSVASSSSVSASALCETATVVRDSASLTQRSHMTEGVMETQSITSHGGHASRFNEQTTIESALEVAAPPLLQCGGCQRLLLLVGTEAEKRKLEPSISKACSGALTTVVIPGVTPVLIHEAQQIAVEGVLERLELVSAADKRVSQRLHTRGDIRWNEPVSG